MAGLVPLTVTAVLQQGLVYDLRYGLAFDGLLTSVLRSQAALGAPGSLLDGGLSVDAPQVWEVPLARCERVPELWHWQATAGYLVDFDGNPVSRKPDPHRLLQTVDERRAEQVAISLPQHLGGARGRYRQRTTPVLVVPAHAVIWHAIGDEEAVRALVNVLPSVGARRGSGEGSVVEWVVSVDATPDPDRFAHCHPDGSLGRSVPEECATALGLPVGDLAPAGIRPPFFHPAHQHLLALPGAEMKGTDFASS